MKEKFSETVKPSSNQISLNFSQLRIILLIWIQIEFMKEKFLNAKEISLSQFMLIQSFKFSLLKSSLILFNKKNLRKRALHGFCIPIDIFSMSSIKSMSYVVFFSTMIFPIEIMRQILGKMSLEYQTISQSCSRSSCS